MRLKLDENLGSRDAEWLRADHRKRRNVRTQNDRASSFRWWKSGWDRKSRGLLLSEVIAFAETESPAGRISIVEPGRVRIWEQ